MLKSSYMNFWSLNIAWDDAETLTTPERNCCPICYLALKDLRTMSVHESCWHLLKSCFSVECVGLRPEDFPTPWTAFSDTCLCYWIHINPLLGLSYNSSLFLKERKRMNSEGFPFVLRTTANVCDFLLESGPPKGQLVFG